MVDKHALYSKIKHTWPNAEEKEFLIGILEKAGCKEGHGDNTPVPASEAKPVPKAEPKQEAVVSSSAGDPNAGKTETVSSQSEQGETITENSEN